MGDYVGFRIKVLLKPETPPEVIDVLRYLTMQVKDEPTILPEDKFFATGSWDCVLSMQSAYHQDYEEDQRPVNERLALFGDYYLLDTSSQPKRGVAISEFLDWIQPYVDPSEYGKEIANSRSEYTQNKTWYAFNETGRTERTETIHEENEYRW